MATYESPLPERMPVIDEKPGADPRLLLSPEEIEGREGGRGWEPRPEGLPMWERGALTGKSFYDANVVPADDQTLIDMIEQMDRDQSSLYHQMRDLGYKIKNQGRSNYCWSYGATTCAELAMMVAGNGLVELSAPSLAAPLTNYTNRGGWGDWALDGSTAGEDPGGWALAADWPDGVEGIDRRWDTDQTRKQREIYHTRGWWEYEPRDIRSIIWTLLNRQAVAVGFNWWGHLVAAVAPLFVDGGFAYIIANSWDVSYGDEGYATIAGRRAKADGIVAVHDPSLFKLAA